MSRLICAPLEKVVAMSAAEWRALLARQYRWQLRRPRLMSKTKTANKSAYPGDSDECSIPEAHIGRVGADDDRSRSVFGGP
jgi:hypothetical protein